MEIKWEIEDFEEDEKDDESFGWISLKDKMGNEIFENYTYIDSWLCTLGNSAVRILQGESLLEADLPEESNYLIFTHSFGKLILSYKEDTLYLSVTEYRKSIQSAIQQCIDCYVSSDTGRTVRLLELQDTLKKLLSITE